MSDNLKKILAPFVMGILRPSEMSICHPERQEGEIWVTNVIDREAFEKLEYKTKRMGEVGYSKDNTRNSSHPVFVQVSELRELGRNESYFDDEVRIRGIQNSQPHEYLTKLTSIFDRKEHI